MTIKRLIGSAPSQVSRNKDLGTMAFQDANSYLSINSATSFRNYIINGAFDVWQRGTSWTGQTGGSNPYADRWYFATPYNAANSVTVTREAFTIGQTEVPGSPKYFMRAAYNAGFTGGADVSFSTRLEDVSRFANKTLTLSFWARIGSGSTTFNNFRTGLVYDGSANEYIAYGNIGTISNTWRKYSYTFTVGSMAGKTIGSNSYMALELYMVNMNMAGNSMDIAMVQLEDGTVATPFERRPYGLELSLCQRYCFAQISTGGYYSFGVSSGNGATPIACITFPVKMRVAPTLEKVAAGSTFQFGSGSATTIVLDQTSETHGWIYGSGGSSSTAGYSGRFLAANNSSAYIIWSAELA